VSGTRLTICALTRPTVANQRMVRRHAAFIVWAAGTLVHGQAFTHDTQSTPCRLTKIINSYPAPLPDGSRVVFQSNRSGVFQIYSMKADGSDVRQLTNMPDDSYGPSYSPDGKLIAFAHGSGGKSDIYIMASDGSAAHQLTTDGLDNSHPHWSPDGRRILFNSSRTTPPGNRIDPTKEQDDVFSVALDGADLRQHTRCNTICTFAFFSPDMKRLSQGYEHTWAELGFERVKAEFGNRGC
jgi:Tol biopolymer transport system component